MQTLSKALTQQTSGGVHRRHSQGLASHRCPPGTAGSLMSAHNLYQFLNTLNKKAWCSQKLLSPKSLNDTPPMPSDEQTGRAGQAKTSVHILEVQWLWKMRLQEGVGLSAWSLPQALLLQD